MRLRLAGGANSEIRLGRAPGPGKWRGDRFRRLPTGGSVRDDGGADRGHSRDDGPAADRTPLPAAGVESPRRLHESRQMPQLGTRTDFPGTYCGNFIGKVPNFDHHFHLIAPN